MHTNTTVALNKLFFELLIVMGCISLNIHSLLSLLTFKNFIINIPIDSLFIFLVLNAVFITL